MRKTRLVQMKYNFTFIILILLSLSACKKSKIQEINYYPDIDNAPNIQILGLKSLYFTHNKLKIKILAPENDFYFKDQSNPNFQFPKGITAIFYNDSLKPISTIKANYAIYYQKLQLWKISGNVEVTNKDGAKLKTQELYYDEKNQKIFSIKFVEVYDTSGSVIRGKNGFYSNIQFKHYEFKNVDGLIYTYKNLTQD